MALGCAPVCVGGVQKKRVLLPSIYLSPREIVVGLSAGTRGRTLVFLSFGRFGSRDDFVFVYLAFGGIGVSTALSGWG